MDRPVQLVHGDIGVILNMVYIQYSLIDRRGPGHGDIGPLGSSISWFMGTLGLSLTWYTFITVYLTGEKVDTDRP